MKHYDIVIVGSGVGLTILEYGLQSGRSCAIVENTKFGGTCLTRGCIPSKILVHPADVIREMEQAKKTGLTCKLEQLDWPEISRRVWSYIDENKRIEASLAQVKNLTVYRGTGAFTGPNTMQVSQEAGGQTEPFTADLYVLAPGGRTKVPPISGLETVGYLTSESFFGDRYPARLWKSLTIIGGGAMGAEFAHIFSAFGVTVTILEVLPNLVATEEPVVSAMLADNFRRNGIDVRTNVQIITAEKTAGGKTLTIRDQITDEVSTVESEEILVASGIRPNSDLLRTDLAGIATDSRGYIITNEYLETNRKNIYALGDINGKYQFRHKANYEADICAHNIFRPDQSRMAARYNAVPWAIYTWPQIAHVGMREQEAKELDLRYMVGVNHYSSIAMGFAMGYEENEPDDGFVKLLVGENKKILGCHVIGPHAALLVQSFVYLMNAGFRCQKPSAKERHSWPTSRRQREFTLPVCLEAGSLDPITQSMVIHPSLNELTAWVIGNLEWSE